MPEISVIIPTYNRAKSLKETLRALAEQELERHRYEVIVVDDGSTDDTEQSVAEFKSGHGSLCLQYKRHPKNQFRAAACNTGVKAARGTFVVFTDDDIRPAPSWLNRHLLRQQALNREASVTGLVLYPMDWEKESNWVRFANENYRLNQKLQRKDNATLPPNRWAGGNTSLRRDLFLRAGMFNEDMRRGQDGDLAFRLHEMKVPLYYEPKALVYHYANAIRSIEATLRSFRRYYERDRVFIKQKYPWCLELYAHWFLEPANNEWDGMQRRWVKKLVRLLARHSGQHLALNYIRAVDRVPWLYCRPVYQYVFACEALEGIRACEKAAMCLRP